MAHPGSAGLARPREQAVADLIQSWVEREEGCRVLLDERFRILWANAAAKRELAQRRDIEHRDGHFAATDPAHQAKLLGLVSSAGSNVTTMAIPCADGDGHVLIRCTRIVTSTQEFCFGMSFLRSGTRFSVTYADLEEVFGLTQAEHRVLLELLDGHTADEIAARLKVSIETTRSHIRQIYLKLDVTSREGMFSRLTPYRL